MKLIESKIKDIQVQVQVAQKMGKSFAKIYHANGISPDIIEAAGYLNYHFVSTIEAKHNGSDGAYFMVFTSKEAANKFFQKRTEKIKLLLTFVDTDTRFERNGKNYAISKNFLLKENNRTTHQSKFFNWTLVSWQEDIETREIEIVDIIFANSSLQEVFNYCASLGLEFL